MDKKLLFLILIVNLDLVAEASLSGHDAGQTMESREKLARLHAGIDLEIDLISFFKLLKILT